MSKACIDRSDSLIFQHKRRPRGIGFTYASSEVQMSVRELRHDRPVVFKIPGFACKRFLPFFPNLSTLFYLRQTGNKKRATCFATLLQNELNGDVARFTPCEKKNLATLFVARQVRTWVLKHATSLFNTFCSNVAKQVARRCLFNRTLSP